VGDNNYGKIEPVVGQAYHQFDFIRLWWPNQDYFGLTWERIINAIKDPRMRQAIFNIWLNRDYDLYGELTNKDMSLTNWYPSARMRLYIRKDVVSEIWNYGTVITQEEVVADPYEGKEIQLLADKIIGQPGTDPGQFQRPHDLAVAADGSIYVADTDNHRIQHVDSDGNTLHVWGDFGDITTDSAPEGTFNQPWGIGLGPDGSVYVADTWNHRVQKFTAEGEFINMWGYFGQAEAPEAFWGPRDIEVSPDGKVFVTDTGNKRIVVFDTDGKYLTQFGEAGMTPGQFDEPVGIALGSEGKIYIADTWNQRVQVMTPSTDETYTPSLSWEIVAWYGQSLDNKPYIAIDGSGNVFITDPEGYRILQFDSEGKFLQFWGTYSTGSDGFGMPASVAIDSTGGVWVSDAGNNRLMHFTLANQPSE
jgi:DNA-binding beta-propeller fold protein YncE